MHKKFTLQVIPMALTALFFNALQADAQTMKLQNSAGHEGFRVGRMDVSKVEVSFSANQFAFEDREVVGGTIMKGISYPGSFLPNEAGYPDLPGLSKFVAIPNGSTPVVNIISMDQQIYNNIDIAPAPIIPLVTNDAPIQYERNVSAYTQNAFYPDAPVKILSTTTLRGVEVAQLGITPFQYNPVTRQLIVYNNIKVEVSFSGGSGQFGRPAYRSRYWEPILQDMLLNYQQLPSLGEIESSRKGLYTMADTGCEYAIIIPNDPAFAQWADSIKKFRREQGILTHVYSLNAIGGSTEAAIDAWVAAAYNTWTIKPAAMLILADFGTNPATTVESHLYPHPASYPDFASDNYFADVTGDDLPDVVFSRIVANNATQLQTMCTKFLNYERNPPTDANFYAKPLTVVGWQDDRWFQVCGETVSGFLKSIGKTPTRVNDLGTPANNTGNNVPNTGNWSTASNTSTVLNYFGPSGLNYIPAQPGTLGGFSGGTATGVNTAINNGAFFVIHRDHGYYSGWGDPAYTTTSINSLTNVNNKLPFVFSINCQTGAYQHTSECFAEKMHRYTKNGQNSGALGLIGDAEVSYSFVNDVMVWGMMDNLWENFMPAYTSTPFKRDKRPAFANASAKYFLQQSSWCGSSMKTVTYQLYHMFGDAFQWFYSEVPQNLTVVHNSTIGSADTTFTVTADAGSFIALTQAGPGGTEILGTATGTGSPVVINLSNTVTSNMLVTVTKQDYFRYGKYVGVSMTGMSEDLLASGLYCYPNPVSSSAVLSFNLKEEGEVSVRVYDITGKEVSVLLEPTVLPAGNQELNFNRDGLAKGVYSIVLKTAGGNLTQHLVIE